MKVFRLAIFSIVALVMLAGCASVGTSSTSGGSASTATVSRIADGTYTYYPRPRMMISGQDIDSYLDKIVVRDGTFNMYFKWAPLGNNRNGPNMGNTAAYSYTGYIFDLDNPGRAPLVSNDYEGEYIDGMSGFIWKFPNHGIKNFRFEHRMRDSAIFSGDRSQELRILEQVVISEPDQEYPGDLAANGTYTFYPRPRFMRDGRDMDAYLDKIVVRGGFFTLYFVAVPEGGSRSYPDFGNWSAYPYGGYLFDLDNPNRPPIQATRGDRDTTDGMESTLWVFPNHNIKNFTFLQQRSDNFGDSPRILEDIIIGDPD